MTTRKKTEDMNEWYTENVSQVYAVGMGRKWRDPAWADLTDDERREWEALADKVTDALYARGWDSYGDYNALMEKWEAVTLPDGERVFFFVIAAMFAGGTEGASFGVYGDMRMEDEHPDRPQDYELLWDHRDEPLLDVGMNGIETEEQLAEVYRQIEEKRDALRKEAEEAFAEGCEVILPLPATAAA